MACACVKSSGRLCAHISVRGAACIQMLILYTTQRIIRVGSGQRAARVSGSQCKYITYNPPPAALYMSCVVARVFGGEAKCKAR